MSNKIGVEFMINVNKIEKARMFTGKKGTYLKMTAFIDPDNEGQYGDHGMVTHKKEEGEDRAPILGNVKVFWRENQQAPAPQPAGRQQAPQQQAPDMGEFDDEIPF